MREKDAVNGTSGSQISSTVEFSLVNIAVGEARKEKP